MKIYLKKGILGDYKLGELMSVDDFYIQDLGNENPERFAYPGDSIKYDLDDKLVILYDTLRDVFFDTNEYYSEVGCLPIFVQSAGQDSDCAVTADMFSKWISDERFAQLPHFYKHLYLVDCQFYVGAIQNHLAGMEVLFANFYIQISEVDMRSDFIEPNTTMIKMSPQISGISAILENYFIKAYSILDMICKIGFEIQEPQEDFSKYRKTKSADVLWGERKDLIVNGKENTLFEKCELVSMIESLRNEIVHNGTWELNPKVFIRFDEGRSVEKFMLFPDFVQGRLATVKNRKHFFSEGTKVNDVLPKIHKEFKERLLNTIILLNHYPQKDR